MSELCTNCQAPRTTPFCGQCGQRAVTGRLDLRELVADAWDVIVNLDSGFLRLLRGLFSRPGRVYAAYLAGARKTYFNPIVYFLLVEGAYITLGTMALRRTMQVAGRTNQAVAEAMVLQADKYRSLLALPVIALVSWALANRRYRLAEVIVFWLFCLGTALAVETVGLVPALAWPTARESIKYAFGVASALVTAWHVVAFFGGRPWTRLLSSLVIVAAALVIFNYAMRIMYRLQGFDAPLGLVPTLRDTFGL